MRFQVTHKLTTYLLVLSALTTLLAGNLIGEATAAIALGIAALSWFVDPGTRWSGWLVRANPVLRAAAAAFFALTAYRVWRHLPEPDLTPILNLVVFLTLCKLFQRTANRDYLQIYVLAFLMVLAGAAFAQSFVFIPAFVVYVVLTTWTLILLHLRREMEENYLVKHADQTTSHKVGVARVLNSRRVIGAPFLAATAGVALTIMIGATATFALVPRVGSGFAFGGQRARRTLIGFSDEVTLGTSGFLADENDTVALRAVLPRLGRLTSDRQREAELDRLYWRGTVYDVYNRGRWMRSHGEALRTRIVETGGPTMIREPHLGPEHDQTAASALAGAERQEIDIVGVSTPVAFALDFPIAFELPPPRFGTSSELRLLPRWSGEVAFHGVGDEAAIALTADSSSNAGDGSTSDLHMFAGAHYVAYSRDPMSTTMTSVRASNGRPLAQIPPEVLGPYLALPTPLAGEITALAQTITAGKTSAIAKVIAVTSWLETTHEYSTRLDRSAVDGSDPVADFLFDRKSGHCEYFASAAALLLRAVGVPTRYVNGFLGGEWNSVGHHVTVRQNRAHAWVEAYLGDMGWMRVDATPPVRPGARMGHVRQILDSIDFLWGRWVVGYDLGRQIDLARTFGRGLGFGKRKPTPEGPGDGSTAGSARARFVAMRIFMVGAVLVGGALVLRRARRGRMRIGPRGGKLSVEAVSHPIARLYGRCVDRLGRQGHHRGPAETAREFSLRLGRNESFPGRSDFEEVTELYIQARFGRRPVADGAVAALSKRLARLGWFKGQSLSGGQDHLRAG